MISKENKQDCVTFYFLSCMNIVLKIMATKCENYDSYGFLN
jgi:hypothetical protein